MRFLRVSVLIKKNNINKYLSNKKKNIYLNQETNCRAY